MKLAISLTMKRVLIGCSCAGTLAAAACADGRGIPTSPSATSPSASLDAPSLAASSPRSADFHVTKACPTYTGQAGDHCTVIRHQVRLCSGVRSGNGRIGQ